MSGRGWTSLFRAQGLRRWQSSSTLPPPVSKFESLSDNSRRFAFALAGFLGGSAFIYSIISPNKLKMSRIKSMVGLESPGQKEADNKYSTIQLAMFSSARVCFSYLPYMYSSAKAMFVFVFVNRMGA